MRPVIAMAIALTLATPSVAFADTETAPLRSLALASVQLSASPRAVPAPDVAAGLSLWVPLGVTVAILPLAGPLSMFAGGLTAGAGHLYAGDPARGVMVSLGGVVVPALGIGLGVGIGMGLAPSHSSLNSLGFIATAGLVAGLASTIGYLLFASQDARHTAERRQVL